MVAALVEGNSIRATVRMTGVSKNTIAKLLVELGALAPLIRIVQCATCPANGYRLMRFGRSFTAKKNS